MRPKIKFITAVWGKDYIERFAALALPSFLAPGNLPALTADADLEVLIMTREQDVATFEQHSAFRRLRSLCETRFTAIDDLITGKIYGVTLTLAYGRAVIACGPEMVNTHFVFMNADFVLADGCLRSLLKHIAAGRSIVLAPSFRAIAETVEPGLEAMVDASGTLSISPRELVRLALPHPHPTTVAKIVNQRFCHSVQPNQFFWRVDENTLVGRYYLIFMLCLKPERVISSINSYCDYCFIPEMCPSGNEAIMADSDDFFMLELQQRDQEMFLIRLGPPRDKDVVASLSHWTTAEHRRAATYDVVFHSEDLPPSTEHAKTEARAFVERIGSMLRRPRSHVEHPHWRGAIDLFLDLRKEKGFPVPPMELEALPDFASREGFYRRLCRLADHSARWVFRRIHRFIMGRLPKPTPFSPFWTDYRHLRDALTSVCNNAGASVLIVRDVSFIDGLVPAGTRATFTTITEVKQRGLASICGGTVPFTDIFYFTADFGWRRQLRYFARQHAAIAGDSGIVTHAFFHGHLDDLPNELLKYFDSHAGLPSPDSISVAGGVLRRINQMLYATVVKHYVRYGIVASIWLVPLLMVELPLFFFTNITLPPLLRGDDPPDYCSSAFVRFGK